MAKKIPAEIVNPQSLRVLMVEDSEDDALLIIRELKKGGYNPVYERVETAAALKKALSQKPWDIILCDYKLPKFNAPLAIAVLKETNIDIPIIIVSGAIGEETAVECMRLGAHDYIMKNNLSRLCPAITRELKEAQSRRKRKQAEENLRESEEKYRTILEDIDEGYYEEDLAGTFTFVNEAQGTNMGYSTKELIGMKYLQYCDEETAKKMQELYSRVYKTGEPFKGVEEEIINKNGTKRTHEFSAALIRDKEGKPIGFRGLVRDVTKRKKAEEAVRESEEKYRTILENIEDGYYEVALNGDFTFFNDSMCRILGYPQEEMMGMNNRQYTDKENAKKLFKTFNEVYRTGEAAKEFDWQIIRKDGTKRYIEVSVSLQKNSSGNPIGFRGISHDITERKQAEETLQKSEKYFKEITENSSDIIIITDKNGDIKYCSRSIERFTGYKPEELISRSVLMLIHQDDKKRSVGDFGKAILTIDSAIPNSFRIVHKDGSTRYFEGLGKNLLDNPAVAGFIMNVRDITARKQTENALQRSEDKYRNILENMQEGYFEIDLSGNYTFVNNALCSRSGYSKEEMIGMNNRQYTDKTIAKKMYEAFMGVYRTGKSIELDGYEVISKDGTKHSVELSISLIKDEAGKPVGFRGVSRDITERKKAEETLRQSEEKYRTILENMQEGYFELDLAGNFTFVNDAECRNLGYPREELLGMNNRQYQDETTAQKSYQLFSRLYKTGESVKALDAEIIRKNGTKGFNEVSVSLIRDVEGKPIGFRGVSRDITERKHAEQALQDTEDRYRALFDRSLDLVYITDFEGRFIDANEAALNRLGYTREEIHALNFASLLSEDQLPLAIKIIQEMQETGIQMNLTEFRLRHKNGSEVYVETQGSAVISNGTPVAIQAIARDITERKKAEEERRESFERMRKALRATVQSISITVEMKDPYTSGHQRRVSDLARSIATEMGLSADRQDFIRTASSIHDIGKISIPTEILSKPTKLTDLEFNLIKTHAQSGHDILKDIEFPWPVADVVLQHHERMDGSGYPQGLKGADILLEARILAIADVVEAIASHRPYRPALGIDLALKEISGNKGILYDADAVDACLKLFEEKGYTLVLKTREA